MLQVEKSVESAFYSEIQNSTKICSEESFFMSSILIID